MAHCSCLCACACALTNMTRARCEATATSQRWRRSIPENIAATQWFRIFAMDAGRLCERHDAHAINDLTTTSSNAKGTHVVPFCLLRKQNDRDEASQNAHVAATIIVTFSCARNVACVCLMRTPASHIVHTKTSHEYNHR